MRKMRLRDLPDAAIQRHRVLVRVDYNVPIEDGRITDDTRIRGTLPTIQHLLDREARIILVSHLGRPKGKWNSQLSLRPVADRLGRTVAGPVHFVEDIAGPAAHEAADRLAPGEILVLENLRFVPGEEANDPKLAEALAALADVYVNDAFGAAHRAHASTTGVAEVMREEGRPAVAGFLLEKELEFLGRALEDPERPFVSIIGGAKISGKIDVIENLLPRVDRLLIGGAMANTFFRAMGLETGLSLVEEDRVEEAKELLARAGDKLLLPVDGVIAARAEPGVPTETRDRDDIPSDARVLDIGPASTAAFGDVIRQARTVLWNGPMGMFEIPEFSQGTTAIGRAVADATDAGATTIVGGGDTAAAVTGAGLQDRVSHVSTGGGASLEFLEGRTLPGVAALTDASDS